MSNIFANKEGSLSNSVNTTSSGSRFKMDRLMLLDDDTARELNTYRNWGYFCAPIEPIFDSETETEKHLTNKSVRSLFNSVNSVGYNQTMQVRANAPLLDSPDMRAKMRETSDCSVRGLVEASKKNLLGKAVYAYSDFMYCKHLGKVSNNYMVTLRRFPFPAGDHINYSDPMDHLDKKERTEKHNPDVGRLVTWLGTPGNEMTNILKFSLNMPFKRLDSKIEEAGDAGGDSGGPLGTFLNATTNKNYQGMMAKGYAGSSTYGYMNKISGPVGKLFSAGSTPPYSGLVGHMDANKVYGPLDVLAWTHVRDTGLSFSQEFSLTFDYELRSYDGINGRAAFLDLIGNILAVTYATGSFWGGAYRGTGASQSNIFANLPIFKLNGNESFSDVVSTFVDSGRQIMKGLGGGTGDFFASAKNIISTLAKGAFSALLGSSLNALGRPHKQALNSLLSPAPVGFWHVMIGNPYHPIMSMGNMILDGTDIEQYGPLGLDDFPTGLKVTIKLKHAKPRDTTLIEQMYMQGESRIYTPVGKEVIEMYKAADKIQSGKISAAKKKAETWNTTYENLKNAKAQQEKDASLLASSGDILSEDEIITNDDINLAENYKKVADQDLLNEMDKLNTMYYKIFGTADTEVITTIAREAAFGSKPAPKKKDKGAK